MVQVRNPRQRMTDGIFLRFPSGTAVTLHVTVGELLLGPKSAPTAFTVPVRIDRQ